jgi:ERCC4-type nuclease
MTQDNFTIIIDTREQHPWEFPYHTTATRKLDTGDYSIEGMEHLLCIERKNGIAEIANNMTESRFKDVIERMSQHKHAYMLIECNYDQLINYPIGSDVPKKLWGKVKISPAFIMKFLTELSVKHNIHIIFCGCPSWAEKTAVSIMKRVYEHHKSDIE